MAKRRTKTSAKKRKTNWSAWLFIGAVTGIIVVARNVAAGQAFY